MNANTWQTCDGWNSIVLCNTGDPADRDILGMTIAEIAARRGQTPAAVCVDIIARTSASAAYETMSQDNMLKFLQFPWVMPGTDGSATSFDYSVKRGHPRYFLALFRASSACSALLPRLPKSFAA